MYMDTEKCLFVRLLVVSTNLQFYLDLDKIWHTRLSNQEEEYWMHNILKSDL